MTKAIQLSALLFYLLCFNVLFAQQTSIVQNYGTENGLPSNGIKGLQLDEKTNFLWIATEAGVVRFNGISFKNFTPDDNSYITNERSLFLIKNNQGQLYTADNLGNIFSISQNKLSFYDINKKHGVAGNTLFAINVSERLYKKRDSINSRYSFITQFNKIVPIDDTSCLVFAGNNLFYYSLTPNDPVVISTRGIAISNLFKIDNSIFFVTPANSIYEYNGPGKNLTNVKFEFAGNGKTLENCFFFWESGMKNPVMINEDKGFLIRIKNGVIQYELIAERIPKNILYRYVQYNAKSQTLFLGTESNGLIVVKKSKLESLTVSLTGNSSSSSYYSQIELSDNTVLTNQGHVITKSNNTTNRDFPTDRFSNFILKDGDSAFWLVKNNTAIKGPCLHRYNILSGKTTVYPKASLGMQSVLTKMNHQLYFTNSIGIGRLIADSIEYLYRYPQSFSLRTAFDIEEISPGKLGIACCNAFLQFDIAQKKVDTLFNAGKYCVRTIWKYKNYIFLGTYGNGLYILKDGKVKALPLDKNKFLLFTHCFINDEAGYCWISTNRGLFKTKIEDLINVFENSNRFVYYEYYGKNDGMLTTEMNGGCNPCAIELKNKVLSFPTMEGLVWVSTSDTITTFSSNSIFIDAFKVNGKKIDTDSLPSYSLSPNTHEIEIQMAYPAWEKKENVYISYKLDDAPTWTSLNDEELNAFKISGLSQGSHTLIIRKANGFGQDNYINTKLTFYISSKWYQKWWFFIVSSLFIFGLIYLVTLLRTKQYKARQRKLELQVEEKTKELIDKNDVLEKNDRLKTRLISIISHDLVAPLKFLSMAGKNLVSKKEMMTSQMQDETLLEIANTSQELQLLSTNLLNWIKYQNKNRRQVKESFEVFEMVNQVISILKSVANQKNIALTNNTKPGLIINQYHEPLKVIVYNLITNAINFTDNGEIAINSHETDSSVIISVKDSGTGMTKEQIQNLTGNEIVVSSANTDNRKGHGLGYLIIKDLLKITETSLKFDSKKGEGTTVSIIIPKEKVGQSED